MLQKKHSHSRESRNLHRIAANYTDSRFRGNDDWMTIFLRFMQPGGFDMLYINKQLS